MPLAPRCGPRHASEAKLRPYHREPRPSCNATQERATKEERHQVLCHYLTSESVPNQREVGAASCADRLMQTTPERHLILDRWRRSPPSRSTTSPRATMPHERRTRLRSVTKVLCHYLKSNRPSLTHKTNGALDGRTLASLPRQAVSTANACIREPMGQRCRRCRPLAIATLVGPEMRGPATQPHLS